MQRNQKVRSAKNACYGYKKYLFDVEMGKSKSIYRSQLMFRNRKHKVNAVEVNKVASNIDDN